MQFLKKLLPYMEIKGLLLALIALAVGVILNLLFPEILRRGLTSASNFSIVKNPHAFFIVVVLLFAFQALAFHYRSYFFGIFSQKTIFKLRVRAFSSLINKEILFFDKENSSNIASRLNADTNLIQDTLAFRLSVIIRYSLQVIIGIFLMCLRSLNLTLITLIIIPPIVLLTVFLGRRLKSISKNQQSSLAMSTSLASEFLGSIKVIKAFNAEKISTEKFKDTTQEVLSWGIKRSKISALTQSSVTFLLNCALLGLAYYAFTLVVSDTITVPDLTAFILYSIIVAVSFGFVLSSYTEFALASGACERIFDVIDERDCSNVKIEATESINSLTLKDINFKYLFRNNEQALRDINLSIERGSFYAICGPSGAGKSSLVSLILGFYKPESGNILLNKKEFPYQDMQNLRERISYVPQEPMLFSCSLKENILISNPSASDKEIAEACHLAGLTSLIETLPDKYNTLIGEKGAQLSGGQKQRVALARAFLKNFDLLILDESTSALDSESESNIYKNVTSNFSDKIILVISHRLPTIQNADTIFVLSDGMIVESGDHKLLLNNSGLYYRLWMQSSKI